MSYVTYPHFYRADVDLGLGAAEPARSVAPATADALSLAGGGLLFAATLYLMIVLIGAL